MSGLALALLVSLGEPAVVSSSAQLFSGLPQAYQAAAAELRVERGPAPTLPQDLREPHSVVQLRGGRLMVLDQGLEQQVALWLRDQGLRDQGLRDQGLDADPAKLAQALLRRQVVHALSHAMDEGLSRSRGWRGLSDWSARGPGEHDLLSYGSVYGMQSPREDLATAAELLVTGVALPGDPELSPACRLRSKFGVLAQAWELTLPECSSMVLDPERIAGLEFLYIQAATKDPSSIGGHLMLGVLYKPDATGHQRRDAYTLAAVTAGTPTSSAMYVVRGLSGGFPSVVQREPYRMTVLRYAQENRGIKRISMVLSPAQLRSALERLDEVHQAWDRPYLFLTRNCTQLPKLILEAAVGQDLGLPDIHGPDSILGAAQRLGVVSEQVAQDARDLSPQDTALSAQALRGAAQARILAVAPELAPHFKQTQAQSPHRRGQAYMALGQAAGQAPGSSTQQSGAQQSAVQQSAARQDLLLYLLWSEQIERYDAIAFGAAQVASPAIDALWVALGEAGALESGGAAVQAAWALEQQAQPLEQFPSAHAALRRVSVMGGVGPAGAQVELSTHLYAYRLGEARKYAMASGLDVAVLPLSLSLGVDGSVGLRSELLHYQHIPQDRVGLNLGWGLRVLPVALRWHDGCVGCAAGERVVVAELGGVLELLQVNNHLRHLGLSVGVAPGWVGSQQGLAAGVAVPLRVFGRLGSGRSALTGLSAQSTLSPVYTAQYGAAPMWQLSSELLGQVRLGELAGVDVALALSARDERGWRGQPSGGQQSDRQQSDRQQSAGGDSYTQQTLLLGLWMERY